ncbi:Glutathione S-transferase [Gracilaria domingensis]|nr:Glutathione S-transferase [Gracilaria domingensis]
MPSLMLTSFDFRGRAEPVRLALVVSGIPFEEHRFSFAQWPDIKPTTPYGSVPTLAVDGEVLAQSAAILRYAGKLGELYPTDALEALRVDEIVDTVEELALVAYAYKGDDKQRLEEQRNRFANDAVPRYASALEARVQSSADAPYAVGGKLSIADFAITCLINNIQSGELDYLRTDIFESYPKLVAVHKAIMELPSVVEWYKKYPIPYQTPKME